MGPDETLFQRVQSGDMTAFDALYARYEGPLFAYLRALLGDRRDAEEVLHDAFLAALRQPAGALGDGGFRAWLFRIGRNLAFNRLRSHRREAQRRAALAIEAREASAAPGADGLLERQELAAALAGAVARLPEPLGELFHLRSGGLSYDEIASVVEVPLGTVKSRMHQMVHALREELTPWIVPK